MPQFVEQSRVLDGDDGLGSEVRDQFDLLVGEWAHLRPKDRDCAHWLTPFEHRDRKHCANAGQFDCGHRYWFAVEVGLIFAKVCNMDRTARLDSASNRHVR